MLFKFLADTVLVTLPSVPCPWPGVPQFPDIARSSINIVPRSTISLTVELKRGGDFSGEYLRRDQRQWSQKVELFQVGNEFFPTFVFGFKVGSLFLPLLGSASKTCNFLGFSRFGFAFFFFFATVILIGGRNPTVASYMSEGRFSLCLSHFLNMVLILLVYYGPGISTPSS